MRRVRSVGVEETIEWHNAREHLLGIYDNIVGIVRIDIIQNLVSWEQLRDAAKAERMVLIPLLDTDFDEAWVGLSEFLNDTEMEYYFGRASDPVDRGLKVLSAFASEYSITEYVKPLGR